jgi:tripartite-type tricarboxylate transporter receptor subunit TctC
VIRRASERRRQAWLLEVLHALPHWIGPATQIAALPAQLPAIFAKLNAAVARVLNMPYVQEKLRKINTAPQQTTLEQASKVIKDDTTRWAAVIKAADLKPAE